MTLFQVFQLRVKIFTPIVVLLAVVAMQLLNMGYFGPLSARVRGLFVKHTRTGNPLVDSVAEHQPANERAYQQYLHHIYFLAPVGFGLSFLHLTDSNIFLVTYAATAYFFSSKMARLIILLGPVASALGGVAIGFVVDQCFLFVAKQIVFPKSVSKIEEDKSGDETSKPKKKGKKDKDKSSPPAESCPTKVKSKATSLLTKVMNFYNSRPLLLVRICLGVFAIQQAIPKGKEFYDYSHELAVGMSQPSIMFKAKLQNGKEIIVDDYRECYWWLRDKTPEDSRIMAWWDYGYQITGIGNRTTIADGNTWNHEHIATLGRAMSATEKKAHRIAKHLADYVLVWAGGGGDDLAKSPHMARIGNSVYPDICPGDPTCSQFGFYQGGIPTPMMKESLLYKLTQFGQKPEIKLSKSRFTHAFSSKYGKCRIFKVQNVDQESKRWVADPANRLCDKPGSWYCPGQYPPALTSLIAKRKNFKQVEDFNTKKTAEDEKYQEEYMARMDGRKPKQTADKKSSEAQSGPALTYLGCYGEETVFGEGRVYGGGATGANLKLAAATALEKKMNYLAIARVDKDGHSFAFPEAPNGKKVDDKDCQQACLDGEGHCGCADGACGSLAPASDGTLRRWATYRVDAEAPTEKKKKKKKKKN